MIYLTDNMSIWLSMSQTGQAGKCLNNTVKSISDIRHTDNIG